VAAAVDIVVELAYSHSPVLASVAINLRDYRDAMDYPKDKVTGDLPLVKAL
jgi:hypothetical protein